MESGIDRLEIFTRGADGWKALRSDLRHSVGSRKEISREDKVGRSAGRPSGLFIAVWIWCRRLAYISRWRLDMLRLWRCVLVWKDRRLLRTGFRRRIFDFASHAQRTDIATLLFPHTLRYFSSCETKAPIPALRFRLQWGETRQWNRQLQQ